VQSVLDELADALIGGESVKLSSFGRFFVRSKSERIGRNPKTGIEVPITERRVMVFKRPQPEHDPEKWKPVFGKDHAQT